MLCHIILYYITSYVIRYMLYTIYCCTLAGLPGGRGGEAAVTGQAAKGGEKLRGVAKLSLSYGNANDSDIE